MLQGLAAVEVAVDEGFHFFLVGAGSFVVGKSAEFSYDVVDEAGGEHLA